MKTLLLLLGGAKLGKLFLSGGSMLLSVVAYSWIFGWWYAVGFVALLFAHEMGHFLAAKQCHLNVGLPTFIPFVGAWIVMKELPHSVKDEAYVGFAGPFIGSLAALGCYYLARFYDSNLLLAIAYAGFFLNLFNLIPVSPLDGGRITAIISPRIWLFGVPLLIGSFFYIHSPLLIFILILALPQLKKAWYYDPKAEENRYYCDVSLEDRLMYGVYYFALVGFLSIMTYEIHHTLQRVVVL